MIPDTSQDGLSALAQQEHNSDAKAKRVILRALDPTTGDYVTISAVDTGDGTYALASKQSAATERFDYSSSTTIYTGEAAIGTGDDSLGWTLTKYDLSDSSDASGKVATDVSWDDRATGTYA